MAIYGSKKKKKNVPIKYTSRDFESIRNDLVEYAKRYYPNTYQDFNEAGFGSLMIDTVSYIGDILSFYLDYQANESFLDTALEFENVLKLGRQMGYKLKGNPSSHGLLTFYAVIPASSDGSAPDTKYMPILRQGSEFGSTSGARFTLVQDVYFGDSKNEIVVAAFDSTTGLPDSFAVKAHGQVISGELNIENVEIGDFEKFLRLEIPDPDFSEIVSVFDAQGNEYFEVDNLSQNIVYRSASNRGNFSGDRVSLLKPFVVPRRFVVDYDGEAFYLQFGYGSENETETSTEKLFDPSKTVLELHGRDYVSDDSFDPSKLITSDKFGIAPENTTLDIVYRTNSSDIANSAAGTVIEILDPILEFEDDTVLDKGSALDVLNSIECDNEQPIMGDISLPDSDELRQRVMGTFSAQNRAVTEQDYQSLIYSMPPKFGAIKRARIIRDANSLKRNLNVYVLAENSEGNLVTANDAIKENLKTWLNKYRMINDTIDILDAKIINIGINFTAMADRETNKYDLLDSAIQSLREELDILGDIGEPFYVTDVYKILKDVDGILDVIDVQVVEKSSGLYSDLTIDLKKRKSADGRYISIPKNAIFEIKYPETDIKGVIK